MGREFRIRLTIVLIIFSLLLSLFIALFDYKKLEDRVRIGQDTKIAMAEDKIIDSLATIDKVYNVLDYQTAEIMETHSKELLAAYEREPDFTKWDFGALRNQFEMDVYILDDKNKVIHSSLTQDLGLNFSECCPRFSNLLDERRNGDEFVHDGMDIQTKTGEIKKFSYVPTPDHRYLIELGVALEDEEIFKHFNFLETIDLLEYTYADVIKSIRVYSPSGVLMGTEGDEEYRNIDESLLPLFKEALQSRKAREDVRIDNGSRVTYRYIPYTADERRGFSTNRVVEIVYTDVELSGMLSAYRNEFIVQVAIILAAAIVLSFIIARLVARPVHLAFHDSLTGLKNRAAFEEEFKKRFGKNSEGKALMMIDLDNFKAVNDKLGHREGDRILKVAATTIEEVAGQGNIAARVGGDEFIVLLSKMDEAKAEQLAAELIGKVNEEFSSLRKKIGLSPSISVGIAFASSGDDLETLYEKADRALYRSKENGKNQYNLYHVG
ncbi:GGDEF domain-containing protein [Sporosarcina sp. FSL W7-1349]|uniref:GGDEF domain-containing protein n=1 Tax=Sporosarcina sp. FSL W7-1349 TaxID=2921561 RepID=UPI0030FA2B1E